MNKLKLRIFAIIVTTGGLLISFQNCSKYAYQDVAGTESLNDGLSSDDLPDDSYTPINQPPANEQTPAEQPPVGEQTPPAEQPPNMEQPSQPQQPVPPVVETPAPAPTEPPKEESQPAPVPPVVADPVQPNPPKPNLPPEDRECLDWALDEQVKSGSSVVKTANVSDESVDIACHSNQPPKQKSPPKVETPKIPAPPKVCSVDQDENIRSENYKNICNEILSANSKDKLKEIAKTYKLDRIYSPLTVGSSHISVIENIRGKNIVCGLAVGVINNTRGKIIVSNSTADKLSKHRGIAIVHDSSIKECSDIIGRLDITGTGVCSNVSNTIGAIKKQSQPNIRVPRNSGKRKK